MATATAHRRQLGMQSQLAGALHNWALRHATAGRAAEALAPAPPPPPSPEREARDVYRMLAAADPQYRPELAAASVFLGLFLSQTGTHGEAINVTHEAVTLYRQLSDRPRLAWALTNLAHRYAAANNNAAAATTQREARTIEAILTTSDPTRRPLLASATLALARFLDAAGQRPAAKPEADRAIHLYEQLATPTPLKQAQTFRTTLH